MENLDIQNTTAKLVGDKITRIALPKKVKLRPTSKEGIRDNLVKFPETAQEVTPVVPAVQPDAGEVVSEVANPSNVTVNPDLQSSVPSNDVATTEGVKEESSVPKPNSKLDGLTFYDLKGKVTPAEGSLPKGLKLKEAKEAAMLSNIPELISTPVAVIEEVSKQVDTDDEFQTVELQLPESNELSSKDEFDSDSDMEEVSVGEISSEQSLESNDFMGTVQEETSEETQDDMEEIETEPIFKESSTSTYSFEKDSTDDVHPTLSHVGLNSKKTEKKKEVVPIYELCEAIDTQRLKTKKAEEEASRLSKDFQSYKEKSQIEIDESYREVKEAGDSQTEAESRYKIAEQEHQTALQNLIDTGKSQQRMLKQRQRDADELIKKVVQEREQLEQTNNTTLAQNQVQLQKYLNKTIDYNTKTQEKREQTAKWEAIAKAMQDPEEDLMGYINPNEVYEIEDTNVYKKAA